MPCRRGLLALLILASFVFLGVNVMFLWNQVPLQPCICNCIDGTDSYRKQSGASAREDDPFSISPVVETVRTTNETKAVMSTEMKTAAATTLESIPPETSKTEIEDFYGPHHLSVVVPFRNRYEEMMEFVPYLHQFLERQRVRHQIWVINQADKHRLTRQINKAIQGSLALPDPRRQPVIAYSMNARREPSLLAHHYFPLES